MVHRKVAIVTPVYNDWRCLGELVQRLGHAFEGADGLVTIIAVDDGSTESAEGFGETEWPQAIHGTLVVHLLRNVGHQRAIAIGLCYAFEHLDSDYVVVMDSDGEDDPALVPRLLKRAVEHGGTKVVVAERAKRSEGLVFRLFYRVYRATFTLLTGTSIRFGNFSVVPRAALKRLTHSAEVWNHFAASVVKLRLPREDVPTARAKRFYGSSKMNLVSLIVHGLSAVSVQAEQVGVRLLVAACGGLGILGTLLTAVVATKVMTTLAIPGWATVAAGILTILLFQLFMLALIACLGVLYARSAGIFVPLAAYRGLVAEVSRFGGAGGPEAFGESVRSATRQATARAG